MSTLLNRIMHLITTNEILISDHGYDELAADGIMIREVLSGVDNAIAIEEYPDFPKGPCLLALQKCADGVPIHVVWGIPKGRSKPAVLITAYKPDPHRWSKDLLRRRK